jgi:hypothetical protein
MNDQWVRELAPCRLADPSMKSHRWVRHRAHELRRAGCLVPYLFGLEKGTHRFINSQ